MFGKRKRTVRVHLDGGPTIEGVLAARTRNSYVLWDAKLLTESRPVELSGATNIPFERVLYYQLTD